MNGKLHPAIFETKKLILILKFQKAKLETPKIKPKQLCRIRTSPSGLLGTKVLRGSYYRSEKNQLMS